jgi:hypothetical protein
VINVLNSSKKCHKSNNRTDSLQMGSHEVLSEEVTFKLRIEK